MTTLTHFEQLKLAAAAVILSPFTPMLFMGEEHGDPAPFQYFVDHSDPALLEAVRKGRREEFAAFGWQDEMPDPCAEATFTKCRINWRLPEEPGPHAALRAFYRELIRMRRDMPAFKATRDSLSVKAHEPESCIEVRYGCKSGHDLVLLFNFDNRPHTIHPTSPGDLVQLLDSSDPQWGGENHAARHQRLSGAINLAPHSVQVLKLE